MLQMTLIATEKLWLRVQSVTYYECGYGQVLYIWASVIYIYIIYIYYIIYNKYILFIFGLTPFVW